MKTRGLATPKQNSDYIYDDPSSKSEHSSSSSSLLRPLVQCPSCPKSFATQRSLFGHFGSSHAKYGGTKLNRDKILYGCPFCMLEDVEFMSLEGVQSHVDESHEGCELLLEGDSNEKRSAASAGAADADAALKEKNSERAPRKLVSHPLGKCPNCPKILLLRGIFGHFGRVHNGIKFDWDKVIYLCPFCNVEGQEGKEGTMFDSFDETKAHVMACHEGCSLIPIGPSRIAQNEAGTSEKKPSPTAQRTSQRRRTSIAETDAPTSSGKQNSHTLYYQCPSCERAFTKQGLATHYGMVHSKHLNWDNVKIAQGPVKTEDGGKEYQPKRKRDDMENENSEDEEGSEDGPVRKSRRISARASRSVEEEDDEDEPVSYPLVTTVSSSAAPTLNFGPWTTEEHEAFMIGYRNHGNEWKRISAQYVPTRTPKQIGSHALAYLTAQGQWEGRKGAGKTTEQEDQSTGQKVSRAVEPANIPKVKVSVETKSKRKKSAVTNRSSEIKRSAWSADEHAAFLEGHKKHGNAWLLISQHYVPSRTPKQVGSHALHHFTALGKWEEAKKSKRDPSLYENIHDMDDYESDDGNFDFCIVCEDGGDLICCSNCPRSYHRSCITNSMTTLPPNWACERCHEDSVVLPNEELPTSVSSADIQSAYSSLVYSEGFERCCDLLTKLSLIVRALKEADHGYIFADPVDLSIVPHYTKTVSCPMDYGTITNKLDRGEYATEIKPLMKRPMEAVLLHVMNDIELVHKNCEMFNPKGSSVFRAGVRQSKKWTAFFKKYISASLPEPIMKAYQRGALDTESEDQMQHECTPTKRKSPKKSKRADSPSGVLLTKEQLDALENIYFSSVADLHDSECIHEANARLTISQWYEKLEDLRRYKLANSTAVVTIAQDDKLYQWIIRQRKRYHFTLHHKPDFKSERFCSSISPTDPNVNDEDVAWLTKSPSMTGAFALSSSPSKAKKHKTLPVSPPPKEEDIKAMAADIKASKDIHSMHQQSLYYPSNASPPYRHSSSLFWDECLEELRFFRGEHNHTLVPRSFPYNKNLSLWVEIQRAKLLLHFVGYDSGILGAQMFILDDELHISDLACSPLGQAPLVSHQTHKIAKDDEGDELDEVHDDVVDNDVVDNNISDTASAPPPVQSVEPPLNDVSPIEAKSSSLNVASNANPVEKGKESRVPLCKCTACEKSFLSLRKLYGHFGSAHARLGGLKINTNDVLFGCPFCQDGLFKPMTELEIHVKDNHPNCQLSKSQYTTASAPSKINRPKLKVRTSKPALPPKKVSLFKRHLSEFTTWYQQHPFPSRDTMSKELYAWCWKQCNAASALLLGTPNIVNTKLNMNATKLKLLATNGFFRVFPYTDKTMIYEDDYEGSEEWEAAFNALQEFSISHGSTLIPDYFRYVSADTRAWITDVHDELKSFIKGGLCELSVQQIEQLILIGFCTDRSDLPNLTRSDVIWLKRFRELKQYQLMIGDCHVTEDFPQLHQWLNEQKKLFRLFRMGNEDVMKVGRIQLLTDAGVDFYTADYLPYLTQVDMKKFEDQMSTPHDLFQGSTSISTPQFSCIDLNDDDFSARFDSMKATNGHSLVSADDNLDLYQWFIAMRSALLDSYAGMPRADESRSLSKHLLLSYMQDRDGTDSDNNSFKTTESLILWTKYCERYMMFIAANGHGHIPKSYPDIALLQWVARQEDELHTHCSKHPINKLPMHLKVLVALGMRGKKRHVQPLFSSRILRRKGPIKSKLKRVEK